MSNDFSPINTPDSDAPMFAPIPSWERGKKRRTIASRGEPMAAEPRSFAPVETPTTLSDDARAYEARLDAEPIDTSFAAAPAYADRSAVRKGNGAAPIAIAAGVILLGGLAAAGYYAYQPHNTGVAELTPGSSTTTTTDVASTAPAASDQQVAQNTAPTPPAAAATTTTTTTTHTKAPVRTTVTHHTVSRSVSDTAANASATAPVQAAPAPAPTPAAPAAAAPPAPLVLNIPPAAAAPTTATAPPASIPAPTQTAPAPAPTQTPPS